MEAKLAEIMAEATLIMMHASAKVPDVGEIKNLGARIRILCTEASRINSEGEGDRYRIWAERLMDAHVHYYHAEKGAMHDHREGENAENKD